MRTYYLPKLYLSAKVRSENHERNNGVIELIKNQFDVFVPHEHQTCDAPHEDLPLSVYLMDKQAMDNSDLAVLIPPYGRDCAFEVGYFVAMKKPVFLYAQDDLSFLSDAMICGGISGVFTANIKTYQRLMIHPVLSTKIYYLTDPRDLGSELLQILDLLSGGSVLMRTI